MKDSELQNLRIIEKDHWYYSGKRDIVKYWLFKIFGQTSDKILVDIGAGTGILAKELNSYFSTFACDENPVELKIPVKFSFLKSIACTATDLPFPHNSIDIITAIDVIEHIRDERKAFLEFNRVINNSGILVIIVPAYQFLWSSWDTDLGHYRRYTEKSLRKNIEYINFKIIHLSYINTVMLIPIFFYRKSLSLKSYIFKKKRLEDWLPSSIINKILKKIFVKLGCLPIKFPFGVSLICIAQKIDNIS